MENERPYIDIEEITTDLFRKYSKTKDYILLKKVKSIHSLHPLIIAAESNGLKRIVSSFIVRLSKDPFLRNTLQNRHPQGWLDEWCSMNDILFRNVLKARGKLRQKGEEVRFGGPDDHVRHRIPLGGGATITETMLLARQISSDLRYVEPSDIEFVCQFLAKSHYGFIRVHPFPDGNGRIARALTDQLAVSLGYPPIIAGFPRLIEEQKKSYHAAITKCIGDPNCLHLKAWIMIQVKAKIEEIA